jgi:hypothetical protein
MRGAPQALAAMADRPALQVGFGTPFAEQLDFLRAKLNLPTDKWDDVMRSAHDRAFIVAGAAKADLLADLRGAVDQAVQGGSLGQFRKDFNAIVAKHGWTGWTGEGSPAGVAWRTKVIYQTNLLTSYAAGRYRQLTDPAMLASHPVWEYVHSESVLHPRPLHLAWNGLTLPAEHAFWQSHFPPNGWGCRCRVRARARPQADAATAPPAGWAGVNAKTGEPEGIDKGFGYAPGATWHPDLDKYPFELARQVVAANLKDGVFERWHHHIEDQALGRLAQPDATPLDKKQKTALVRALARGEEMPVAVLSPAMRDSLGVQTQSVMVSDYDLLKQVVSREKQYFDAERYFNAQLTLDDPRLVVRETDQMTIFVSDVAGQWYAAVLQQTQSGKGIYLKSWRRSSEKDARTQKLKRGATVLVDKLSGSSSP